LSATVPFQPKLFYRDLDRLLGEAEGGGLYAEWFPWIVGEVVERFGRPLGIAAGRLFVEDEGEFETGGRTPVRLSTEGQSVDAVIRNGIYLFDGSAQPTDATPDLGAANTAGVAIEGEPRRLLAFRLRPGWVRDDLDFALNTLRNAIHDRMRFQEIQVDLEQAAEIQRSLLPRGPFELPGYTIAARSIPATAVGGDLYEFARLDEETMLVAIGDASGHGLAAALLARDVVTGLRMGAERSLKITEVVHRLNRVIARSVLSTRFISLFAAELETNGNVFYVNAGHPAPRLFGERGERRLERGGMILGPVPAASFRRGFAHVDRGDTLVLVTDGVLERINDAGRMFGEDGVEKLVAPRAGQPAEGILTELLDACFQWGRGRPWSDDTSAIVISRAPTG
jgi:hypothetical protein